MEVSIVRIEKLEEVIKEPIIRGIVEQACTAMAREAYHTRSLLRMSAVFTQYDDRLHTMREYTDTAIEARRILAETFVYYGELYRLTVASEREE